MSSTCPLLRAGIFAMQRDGRPTGRAGSSDCLGEYCAIYKMCQIDIPKLLEQLVKEREPDDGNALDTLR